MDYHALVQRQRDYFATGITLPVNFRLEQLFKLKKIIKENENLITEALRKDLHRPREETVIVEVIVLLDEIDHIIKNLKTWAQPQKVPSPFPLHFPGRSQILFEPYGCALIIAPWNYPFFLTLSPLIGAICAGNCAVIKPSELGPESQNVITQLINQHFPPEFITTVQGGPAEVTALLEEPFDYIFYTGSTQVGKIIMQAAAKHLTPVTLELGGKSPCIVDATANLSYAARRIMWGKMTNAGQTCIAPDYLYVHKSVKEALIRKFSKTLLRFYGKDPASSPSYDRIINKKHFERLTRLMQNGKIILGGQTNENDLYIAPTLIDDVTWNDPIMQEEIFGPLLPILTFESLDEVITTINAKPKPLAAYLFTRNAEHEAEVLKRLSFGGGCINDCIMHIANPNLPFGGVGASGMGGYHGRYSFETFSHRKSIYKRTPQVDLRLEYPPFGKRKLSWLRRMLRI